jgi:hypothetical protein
MGSWFRSRVGVALIGAIIVGCIAAIIGVGTLTLRSSPLDGAFANTNSGSSATATAESAETPGATATAEATATPQPTATATPRIVPTSTPLSVGSTLRGSVSGTPGADRFTVSRNGVHYTILVDGNTQFTGAATQLSGLRSGYHVTVTISAVYGSKSYQASAVASVIDN